MPFFSIKVQQTYVKNMQIFINNTDENIIIIISSYFSFVFLQRRDRREAFFGDISPQRAEPQHRS